MSQGLLDAQNGAQPSKGGISRRTFLKFGVTIGAATGGGLLLGFSMPAVSQDQKAGKSVIGGDGDEAPQSGVFAPNAFIQIDTTGKVTLVIPKVEMGQGIYTSIPMLIAEEARSAARLGHPRPCAAERKALHGPAARRPGSLAVRRRSAMRGNPCAVPARQHARY